MAADRPGRRDRFARVLLRGGGAEEVRLRDEVMVGNPGAAGLIATGSGEERARSPSSACARRSASAPSSTRWSGRATRSSAHATSVSTSAISRTVQRQHPEHAEGSAPAARRDLVQERLGRQGLRVRDADLQELEVRGPRLPEEPGAERAGRDQEAARRSAPRAGAEGAGDRGRAHQVEHPAAARPRDGGYELSISPDLHRGRADDAAHPQLEDAIDQARSSVERKRMAWARMPLEAPAGEEAVTPRSRGSSS